jgi:hypothetical protein
MPGVGDIFPDILTPFKETITLVHREETSQGQYGEPEFTETTEAVSGIFQIVKAPDLLTEPGIKELRQANLFLRLGTTLGLLDQVEVPDSYPGIRWAVMGQPYQSNLQMEVLLQEVAPQ